jgi:hypothetical protein
MYFLEIKVDAFIGIKEWGAALLFPALLTAASSLEVSSLVLISSGTAFSFAGVVFEVDFSGFCWFSVFSGFQYSCWFVGHLL